MNVENVLFSAELWILIWGSTQGWICIIVRFVAKVLIMVEVWMTIWGPTKGWNCIAVGTVAKVMLKVWIVIGGFTQRRNSKAVILEWTPEIAWKISHRQEYAFLYWSTQGRNHITNRIYCNMANGFPMLSIWIITWGFTQGRNNFTVMIVSNVLILAMVWKRIWRFTHGRNHIAARSVLLRIIHWGITLGIFTWMGKLNLKLDGSLTFCPSIYGSFGEYKMTLGL